MQSVSKRLKLLISIICQQFLPTLSAKTLTELELTLAPELIDLSCWLKASKLSLNVATTELMAIGSRQRLSVQCDYIEIKIDDQIMKRVVHIKSLGLTIVPISLGLNTLKRFAKKSLRL